jgi:hypothetical protein
VRTSRRAGQQCRAGRPASWRRRCKDDAGATWSLRVAAHHHRRMATTIIDRRRLAGLPVSSYTGALCCQPIESSLAGGLWAAWQLARSRRRRASFECLPSHRATATTTNDNNSSNNNQIVFTLLIYKRTPAHPYNQYQPKYRWQAIDCNYKQQPATEGGRAGGPLADKHDEDEFRVETTTSSAVC